MGPITTIEFLHALYPDPVHPGELLVWTASKSNGKQRSHWVYTLDQANTEAHRYRSSRQAFFGVALHDSLKARAPLRFEV